MDILERKYRVPASGLSSRELFLLLQEVSTIHCDELGYGMEVVGPRGLIWVVVRQRLELIRCPLPGEEICLRTWPGLTRHGMFPRYYTIESKDGQKLGEACALWTLVDAQSRRMIRPEDYGVDLKGLKTGEEGALPRAPEKLEQQESRIFTVPEEYLDLNGHMNNTRYYELAELSIGPDTLGDAQLCRAVTEYSAEALLGDALQIRIGRDGGHFYITGDTEEPIFKMHLEYKRSC